MLKRSPLSQRLERVPLPQRSEGNPGLSFTRKMLGDYWTEGEAYLMDDLQTVQIRQAVEDISALFGQAMDRVVGDPKLFARFAFTGYEKQDQKIRELIKESRATQPNFVFDRLDIAWDGVSPPKLLERNMGFVGLLVTTDVVQEEYAAWLQTAARKSVSSFGALRDQLLLAFQKVAIQSNITPQDQIGVISTCGHPSKEVDFSGIYLRDRIKDAGYKVRILPNYEARVFKGQTVAYHSSGLYFSLTLETPKQAFRFIGLLQNKDLKTINEEFKTNLDPEYANHILGWLSREVVRAKIFKPITVMLPRRAVRKRELRAELDAIYSFVEFEDYAHRVAKRRSAKNPLPTETKTLLPYWTLLAAHKGMLAVLHEMNPTHPNLLPTYWGTGALQGQARIAKKTIGVQGMGSVIYDAAGNILADRHNPLAEVAAGYITQKYCDAVKDKPNPDGPAGHRVFHVFTTNGTPAAIGARVSAEPIVGGGKTGPTHYVPVFTTRKKSFWPVSIGL